MVRIHLPQQTWRDSSVGRVDASYALGRWFDPNSRYYFCRVRISVSSSAFHAEKRGSIPLRGTFLVYPIILKRQPTDWQTLVVEWMAITPCKYIGGCGMYNKIHVYR